MIVADSPSMTYKWFKTEKNGSEFILYTEYFKS